MQPNELERLTTAINAAKSIGRFYCKFITANDVGLTNAHQEGLHISKEAWNIFFEEEGTKGENKDKIVKIHMDGFYRFESRIIYYGKRTRNEYRITRFWTNFPLEKEQQVGNLVIFIPLDLENYRVYIFDTEVGIETFTETFNLSLLNNNAVYYEGVKKDIGLSKKFETKIDKSAASFKSFPETIRLAELARELYLSVYKKKRFEPDKSLLKWIEIEYSVFREIEKNIYKPYLIEPFYKLDPLLEFASSALNRRKSRAGRSLEHHINYILGAANLPFSHPGTTEGKKKPDFLLPSSNDYADKTYDSDDLIFLGVKTTCKDRWRQILNEADRIPEKFLLTLQQGITVNQIDEMQDAQVNLIVPEPYHKAYPEIRRDRLWTIDQFIHFAKDKYTV